MAMVSATYRIMAKGSGSFFRWSKKVTTKKGIRVVAKLRTVKLFEKTILGSSQFVTWLQLQDLHMIP